MKIKSQKAKVKTTTSIKNRLSNHKAMIQHTTQIRVRYSETDAMKYVYYGNYAQYFEVARVELFRSLGISYDEIEKKGILMPVSEHHTQYLRPAKYDELLTIKTKVIQKPTAKIIFDYEIFNAENERITTASTTLFFFDEEKKKIIRCPSFLTTLIDKYWSINPSPQIL